jgi:hypothetical protein
VELVEQKYASLALQLLTVVLLAVIAFELATLGQGVNRANGYLQTICWNSIPADAIPGGCR